MTIDRNGESMKVPWVNLLLLILLVIQTVTGYFGMTNGRESNAWVLWVHGLVAYMLLLLLFLKSTIILDTWRRKKRWTGERFGFLVTLALLVIVVILGLLWTFIGPIYLGGFSLVSLHIYFAVPLMVLMLWHSWRMRFIFRVNDAAGRRLFLGGLATAISGYLFKTSAGWLKVATGFSEVTRRFTGSYEQGSFTGDFPVVSWIADRPPPIDSASWHLSIEGAVNRPIILSHADVVEMPQQIMTAYLDCTGGWYSIQRWQGVRVDDLLALAGVQSSAASVTFEAVSGYRRRFSLDDAKSYLLALGIISGVRTGLADEYRPLDHGHGFPIRLVAPGKRGMEWVKWVTLIRVNTTGPHLQSPLPLQ